MGIKKSGMHITYSLLVFISILILPLVYADLNSVLDSAKSIITGRAQQEQTSITLTVGNTPPVITSVDTILDQTITEGGTKLVTFRFRASDADGVANLADATAMAEFRKAGEITRTDPSCTWIIDLDATTAEYECTVGIEFYDGAGAWTVYVAVDDIAAATGEDQTTAFNLLSTSSISISPSSLTWPALSLLSTNVLSNNDPITATNIANTDGSLQVTAFNIPGETTPTEFILASDFRVNIADACGGDAMIDNLAVSITSTTLPRGAASTEDIFFCLTQVSAGASQQVYSTTTPWLIGFI